MTAIRTVDYHTGGEPFRIVTGGVEPLRGATILDRRRDALERLDHVRRLLVYEPRGHADMYGCHVVPAERRRAPTSASSSSTTPATRRPAGTGRSRSSRGRSTRGSSSGTRARTASSSTCRRAGSRPWATVRGRPGALGALPQRAVVRLGDGVWLPAGSWSTSPSAARSTPPCAERVEPGELPRLIELGRAIKRGARGGARDRPPARAGAARRLRRHLLAAGGRRSR